LTELVEQFRLKTSAYECSCDRPTHVRKRFGGVPVGKSKTTAIPLILPPVQAMALAQFVKRVDFEAVTRFATVTVVCDGKSEADLIWLALIALRRALAEAGVAPR